ncbi:MAG: hypothetical protein GX772_07825 [Alcaligenaceae bacterium]|nr:hypothetical protein [Alcaligenaceae bacterium]
MGIRNTTLAIFWLALALFLGWDWVNSADINHRHEPPLFAAGSGQAPTGGHCSAF